MKKLVTKYRNLKFEEKVILTTAITMSVSLLIAAGKIVIGLLTNFIICAVGIFNIMLLLAKLECILGAKSSKLTFVQRNTLVAVFLFLAGVIYIIYMVWDLYTYSETKQYTQLVAIALSFIGFLEMGLAIYGLVKVKNRGHFYRNIKIINFSSALTAIMTAQIALLAFTTGSVSVYNNYTGIGIGVLSVLLSVYIYFAPKISVIDRQHNRFSLIYPQNNGVIDMSMPSARIILCKSVIYGNYVFEANIADGVVDGHIKKTRGFFKGLNIALKIFLIILSEVLIFIWAAGYVIYFCRTVNMPKQLEIKMNKNGFKKIICAEDK